MADVPINANFYVRSSKGLPPNELLNLFAEITETPHSRRVILHSTPGLVEFTDLGTGAPVQGLFKKDNALDEFLYAVSDNTLFRVAQDGTVTNLGAMANLGDKRYPVQFANSDTQLVMQGYQGKAYSYAVAGTPTQVTIPRGDTGCVAFLGSYFLYGNPNNGEFYFSELLDATDVSALAFITAEEAADGCVAFGVLGRDLWIFGKETIEIWNQSGSQTKPFTLRGGSSINRGLVSQNALVSTNNGLYFIGDDLTAYTIEGFSIRRISTHAIEGIISSISQTDRENIYGWGHSWEGHKFVAWRIPNHGTLVYDITTGTWHQRSTHSTNEGTPDYRVMSHTEAYGKHYIGDSLNGKIYEMSDTKFHDGGEIIERMFTTTVDVRQRVVHSNMALDMSRGLGMDNDGQSGLPANTQTPRAELEVSDDFGGSWSVPFVVEYGDEGDYEEVPRWNALGMARPPGRTVKITITDPTRVTIWGIRVNDRDLF